MEKTKEKACVSVTISVPWLRKVTNPDGSTTEIFVTMPIAAGWVYNLDLIDFEFLHGAN